MFKVELVNDSFSDEFLVLVRLNQCSTLNLLSILLSEPPPREMRSTCQEKLFYADGLVWVNESLEGFIKKQRSVAKYLTKSSNVRLLWKV